MVYGTKLHISAGSIIMATDSNNHYLVTADVDGLVKVWEIQTYALSHVNQPIETAPSEWMSLDLV